MASAAPARRRKQTPTSAQARACPPVPVAAKHPIYRALLHATAEGVLLHVPSGIQIVVIAVPSCAVLSFLHLVLGVSVELSGGAVSIGWLVLKRNSLLNSS